METKSRQILLPVTIFILTISIFWPGFSGPFLLDDHINVLNTLPKGLNLPEVIRIIKSNYSSQIGRPIPILTFILNSHYGGMNAVYFKWVNILIHLLNGLLIFIFIQKLLRYSSYLPSQNSQLIAMISMLIWLLHPLQVSTVLYVVQRMTELAALFTLLALINYLNLRQHLITHNSFPVKYFFCLGACFVLALLSKENGALIALFIPLIELYFFKFKAKGKQQRYKLILIFSIFSVVPIILGLFYFYTHSSLYLTYFFQEIPTRGWSISERLLSQINVLVFYLQNILVPNINKMSLLLDGFPVTRTLDPRTLINGLVLFIFVLIALTSYKKFPVLSFGISFYFAGQVLESSIHPLEIAFEHRNYLPLLGIVFPISYYLIQTLSKKSLTFKVITIGPIILLLSFSTFVRSSDWGDEKHFYMNELKNQPLSLRAHIGLINIILKDNKIEEARNLLKKASSLPHIEVAPIIHHALTFCKVTSSSEAEVLIKQAAELIKERLISGMTHESINIIQLQKMKQNCPAISLSALVNLTEAALTNPRYSSDPEGRLFLLHARSLNIANRKDEAVKYYEKALKKQNFSTQKPQILLELGILQLKLKNNNSANNTLQKIVQLHNPPFSDTQYFSERLRMKINQSTP